MVCYTSTITIMPRQFDPSLIPASDPIDLSAPCYIIVDNTLQVHNVPTSSPEVTSMLRSGGFGFDAHTYSLCAPYSEEKEKWLKEVLGLSGPVEENDERVNYDYARALKARVGSGEWTTEEGRSQIQWFICSLVEDGTVIEIHEVTASKGKAPDSLTLYRELSSSSEKVSFNSALACQTPRIHTGYVKSIWHDDEPDSEQVFVSIVRMAEQSPITESIPIEDIVEQEKLLDFIIANLIG